MEENLFGKQRGRFNENAASESDRTAGERAIAILVSLPESEWPGFIAKFNRCFRWGKTERAIVETHRS
jgi:hypothetical protein